MVKIALRGVPHELWCFYHYTKDGVPTITHVILAPVGAGPEQSMTGMAICHPKDQPNKVFGRTLALIRLAMTHLTEEEEASLWAQLQQQGFRLHHPMLQSRLG